MNDVTTYRSSCSIPTLAETVQRYIPGAAGLTEAECQSLIDEAKAAAPKDATGPATRSARAKWMVKYIKAAIKAKTAERAA